MTTALWSVVNLYLLFCKLHKDVILIKVDCTNCSSSVDMLGIKEGGSKPVSRLPDPWLSFTYKSCALLFFFFFVENVRKNKISFSQCVGFMGSPVSF